MRKIAIQGVAGAFHDIAAHQFFSDEKIDIVPFDNFEDLFKTAENAPETVDFGLAAIENTLVGGLMGNYKLLLEAKNLRVVGEHFLRIRQNLMVNRGVKIDDLTEVYSHPVALAQCRDFFKKYPKIRLIEAEDTALSAKNVAQNGSKNIGAVASSTAAELYNLEIIAPGIETNKQNFTRFLVLQHVDFLRKIDDADKVSICFALDHEVGSLHKILAILANFQLNLTKIQSAPIVGRSWEYRFFVDFVVENATDWRAAISEIELLTHYLRVFGAYRRGHLPEESAEISTKKTEFA
jgi:prephenate dehydratase